MPAPQVAIPDIKGHSDRIEPLNVTRNFGSLTVAAAATPEYHTLYQAVNDTYVDFVDIVHSGRVAAGDVVAFQLYKVPYSTAVASGTALGSAVTAANTASPELLQIDLSGITDANRKLVRGDRLVVKATATADGDGHTYVSMTVTGRVRQPS